MLRSAGRGLSVGGTSNCLIRAFGIPSGSGLDPSKAGTDGPAGMLLGVRARVDGAYGAKPATELGRDAGSAAWDDPLLAAGTAVLASDPTPPSASSLIDSALPCLLRLISLGLEPKWVGGLGDARLPAPDPNGPPAPGGSPSTPSTLPRSLRISSVTSSLRLKMLPAIPPLTLLPRLGGRRLGRPSSSAMKASISAASSADASVMNRLASGGPLSARPPQLPDRDELERPTERE